MRTTIPAQQPSSIPDRLRGDFRPTTPDIAWAGDITYVATGQGWLYLATVVDLGSKHLIGYSKADQVRTELVADALRRTQRGRGGHFSQRQGLPVHLGRLRAAARPARGTAIPGP